MTECYFLKSLILATTSGAMSDNRQTSHHKHTVAYNYPAVDESGLISPAPTTLP
jgi:hypothetical protein